MNDPTLGDEGLAVSELEDVTPSRLALTWLLHRGDAILIPHTGRCKYPEENAAGERYAEE